MPVSQSKPCYLTVILLVIIIIASAFAVYYYWFELITVAQQWQRYFHQQLVQFLLRTKQAPWDTGWLLVCFSLLYGILHSAGPGHGKVIITTYLATQKRHFKKCLLITVLSAILQGIVAIALITILLMMLNLSTKYLTIGEYQLERASYLVIMFVGVFLCYKAIKKLVQQLFSRHHSKITINSINPLQSAEHQHQLNCDCCGHQHIPAATDIEHKKGWLGDLGIILAIGIRPCSGALLMLIFAYTLGVYHWGIIATLAMSIGTALTTSLIALLVYHARKLAEQLVKHKQRSLVSELIPVVTHSLALIGGIVFVIMGLVLCLGMSHTYVPLGNPLLMR
ncbi:ABC-type nickel/cobalt efflux system permease component RcnA [Orbus hercynius]|uniref:Nickel/cobalt efflux system n=1 Tax=Orbus hercynius TaxID=593135 RepID=A0A495RCU2_9GAMM|nr:nickel/cobalt transporter [Orbus hercynius]RKS85185.1 ABC-type nickel/cobalt efflux system permease component RcnA [Orbus hercynius]